MKRKEKEKQRKKYEKERKRKRSGQTGNEVSDHGRRSGMRRSTGKKRIKEKRVKKGEKRVR